LENKIATKVNPVARYLSGLQNCIVNS